MNFQVSTEQELSQRILGLQLSTSAHGLGDVRQRRVVRPFVNKILIRVNDLFSRHWRAGIDVVHNLPATGRLENSAYKVATFPLRK